MQPAQENYGELFDYLLVKLSLTADLLLSRVVEGTPAADWLLMRSLDDAFLGKPSGEWLLFLVTQECQRFEGVRVLAASVSSGRSLTKCLSSLDNQLDVKSASAMSAVEAKV